MTFAEHWSLGHHRHRFSPLFVSSIRLEGSRVNHSFSKSFSVDLSECGMSRKHVCPNWYYPVPLKFSFNRVQMQGFHTVMSKMHDIQHIDMGTDDIHNKSLEDRTYTPSTEAV